MIRRAGAVISRTGCREALFFHGQEIQNGSLLPSNSSIKTMSFSSVQSATGEACPTPPHPSPLTIGRRKRSGRGRSPDQERPHQRRVRREHHGLGKGHYREDGPVLALGIRAPAEAGAVPCGPPRFHVLEAFRAALRPAPAGTGFRTGKRRGRPWPGAPHACPARPDSRPPSPG